MFKVPGGKNLWAASFKTWKLAGSANLPGPAKALRVIKQRLWCCLDARGVSAFTPALELVTIQKPSQLVGARDVTELSNGDIITATLNGLFKYQELGEILAQQSLALPYVI